MPADGAVEVEGDGDEWEQKGLRGCGATRPEAARPGSTSPVARIGTCGIRRGGGSSWSPNDDLPRRAFLAGYADPPFEAGFALLGFGCRGLAKKGRTRGRFRVFREPARLSPAHQPNRP